MSLWVKSHPLVVISLLVLRLPLEFGRLLCLAGDFASSGSDLGFGPSGRPVFQRVPGPCLDLSVPVAHSSAGLLFDVQTVSEFMCL